MNKKKTVETDSYSGTGLLIKYFFIFYYLLTIGEFLLLFGGSLTADNSRMLFFNVAVTLTYPFFYILPSLVATYLVFILTKKLRLPQKVAKISTYTAIIISAGMTMIFLFIDYKIDSMFSFHINSFVLNLIFTPGGLESMGASNIDIAVFVFLFLCSFGIVGGIVYLTAKLVSQPGILLRKINAGLGIFLTLFVVLSIAEKVDYAFCAFKDYPGVYTNSEKVPFYIPTRMNKFFRKLNIKEAQSDHIVLKNTSSILKYPLVPIKFQEPKQKYNIVWLVAESWRADTLTPEIMPAATKFAEKCIRFKKHYSSGNGTRMALFGMFYGLYGSYWKAALEAKKSPVIMDILQEQNYQFDMYTSAMFTYPEFDKTIFVNIPKEHLHQSAGRGGFVYDRQNISSILSFIKHRDPARPFMTFMFFESPHAPYTFPDDCVVRRDYLPTFNYSTVDIPANITKIKNRYINAVHHLDTQFARVFKFLEEEKLLDTTIVIITGDHGEEFLEKGHWGHNKGFDEEEITPPLMIYIPGEEPRDITTMSSHLDIPAMIAPVIGIKNKSSDFSLGYNLLKGEKRKYNACASWSELCYIDNTFKYDIEPMLYNTLTTVDDAPVSKKEKEKLNKSAIFDLMKNAARFYEK